MPQFDVWVPEEVQRFAVAKLRGKRTGLKKALRRLEADPCHPKHYRIQGPLHPKICGLHLSASWRLAFSFLAENPEERSDTVTVLYIGDKEPGRASRQTPMWQCVHELFGEEYTKGLSNHEPCCADGLPSISEDEVIDLMDRLRRLSRARH